MVKTLHVSYVMFKAYPYKFSHSLCSSLLDLIALGSKWLLWIMFVGLDAIFWDMQKKKKKKIMIPSVGFMISRLNFWFQNDNVQQIRHPECGWWTLAVNIKCGAGTQLDIFTCCNNHPILENNTWTEPVTLKLPTVYHHYLMILQHTSSSKRAQILCVYMCVCALRLVLYHAVTICEFLWWINNIRV